jgi:hypothetical protein
MDSTGQTRYDSRRLDVKVLLGALSMGNSRAGWITLGVCIGLLVGISLSGVLPQTPIHASATHGQDSFAIATGMVDNAGEIEAVYFLDFLTGDLRAGVLSYRTGKFLSLFQYNVMSDLVTPGQKNPRFLMVTGIANFRAGFGNTQPARSVVYVAEASGGQMGVYAIPFSPAMQTANVAQAGSFILLDKKKFRTSAVRETE